MAPPTDTVAESLRLTDEERRIPVAHATGKTAFGRCSACHGTGYQGRTGLYEVLSVTRAIRQQVLSDAPDTDTIRQIGLSEGLLTLRMDGIRKAQLGQTTLEQVLRETSSDDQH